MLLYYMFCLCLMLPICDVLIDTVKYIPESGLPEVRHPKNGILNSTRIPTISHSLFMISRVLPVFKITGVCVTPCTLLGMIMYDRFLIELSLSQNNPQYEIIIFLSKIRYVCVSEIKFLVYFHTYIYFLSKTNRYKVGAFFIHMVNFIFV